MLRHVAQGRVGRLDLYECLIAQLSTVLRGSLGCQRDLLELVKPCFCIWPFPPTSALQNVREDVGSSTRPWPVFKGSLLVLAQVASKVEEGV